MITNHRTGRNIVDRDRGPSMKNIKRDAVTRPLLLTPPPRLHLHQAWSQNQLHLPPKKEEILLTFDSKLGKK